MAEETCDGKIVVIEDGGGHIPQRKKDLDNPRSLLWKNLLFSCGRPVHPHKVAPIR